MARSDHGFVEGELAGGKKLAALEKDVGGMGDLRREFIAVLRCLVFGNEKP